MDIRGLKYLLTIAECASVPRAAEVLGVSRQSAGKELRHLEAETGMRLFDRRGGELVPTDECAALLADARDVVERFDDLCICHFNSLGARGSRGGRVQDPGTLNVAMVVGCSDALPEQFFESYLTLNPGVRLDVEEMSSDAVLEYVADGRSDVGVVGSHPDLLDGYECCKIVSSGVWVVMGEDDPLAAKPTLALKDLDGRALVTPGKRNHVHRFVMRRCALAGIEPNVIASSTSSAVLSTLMPGLNALCFGFPPDVAPPPPGATVRPIEVEGAGDFGTYAIRRAYSAGQKATGNTRSRAGILFWDMCRAFSSRGRRKLVEDAADLTSARVSGGQGA